MKKPDDLKKSDHLKKSDEQKRPYDTPRLTLYGDLRLRTWGNLTGAMGDGGVLNLTHTG